MNMPSVNLHTDKWHAMDGIYTGSYKWHIHRTSMQAAHG